MYHTIRTAVTMALLTTAGTLKI